MAGIDPIKLHWDDLRTLNRRFKPDMDMIGYILYDCEVRWKRQEKPLTKDSERDQTRNIPLCGRLTLHAKYVRSPVLRGGPP